MQYRDIAFLCGYFSVKNGNPNDIFASQGGFPVEDLNRHGFATELTTYGNFARHYSEWIEKYDVLVINNSSYSGAMPVWETASPAQARYAVNNWLANGKKVIYYARPCSWKCSWL